MVPRHARFKRIPADRDVERLHPDSCTHGMKFSRHEPTCFSKPLAPPYVQIEIPSSAMNHNHLRLIPENPSLECLPSITAMSGY